MAKFDDLMRIDPHYAIFFLKLVKSEIDEKKEREQVLDRIAHNCLVSRQLIKMQNIDLFAVKSVESLEDLLYKTRRDSQVDSYAKGALSGIAKRQNVLQGAIRERALQSFEDTMEKVSDSKAVVEYDDGRMALVWIPDFETSKKLGTHNWMISRISGQGHWDGYTGKLNKCYMIVDRALPASNRLHKFSFFIGPHGNVTSAFDQEDYDTFPEKDKDFQKALKVTGARPYNRSDVLQSDQAWLLQNYMDHHGDWTLLSQKVLTANNPAIELGRLYKTLTAFAEINLPACRRLVLRAARQCAEKEVVAVIDESFVGMVCKGDSRLTEEISSALVGMMPSIVMAQKYCTAEVIELAKTTWLRGCQFPEKARILDKSIQFGNRTMVVSLINSSWADPSKLSSSGIFPKVLSLGAKINRLMLDSGFQPNHSDVDCAKPLLFPSSQEHSESAKLYFSDPQIQCSPKFASSLCLALGSVYRSILDNQSTSRDMHSQLLENIPWVLKLLKRVLSENSREYTYHLGRIVSLGAGYRNAETAVANYPQQINLLLDELDRVKKQSSKETFALLGRWIGDIKPAPTGKSF